jgi:DNA-binding LacI/PurR family transcriptional regulator
VIGLHDRIAPGACQALQAAQIEVPEGDIGDPVRRLLPAIVAAPPSISIAQPHIEIGRQATEAP